MVSAPPVQSYASLISTYFLSTEPCPLNWMNLCPYNASYSMNRCTWLLQTDWGCEFCPGQLNCGSDLSGPMILCWVGQGGLFGYICSLAECKITWLNYSRHVSLIMQINNNVKFYQGYLLFMYGPLIWCYYPILVYIANKKGKKKKRRRRMNYIQNMLTCDSLESLFLKRREVRGGGGRDKGNSHLMTALLHQLVPESLWHVWCYPVP